MTEITGGIASREDPPRVDIGGDNGARSRVARCKTRLEAVARAAEALAYSEECIVAGKEAKAKLAMQLAGHYRGIAPLLPAEEGGD